MKGSFTEIEAQEGDTRLKCDECGHVVKKRTDSFVPGLHVIHCLGCGTKSDVAVLLSGEVREHAPADWAGTG